MLIFDNKNLISHFEARPLYLQPIFFVSLTKLEK